MADYLTVKRQPDGSWGEPRTILNKPATTAGADAAIAESFVGPGDYCAVRFDSGRFCHCSPAPPGITVLNYASLPPLP